MEGIFREVITIYNHYRGAWRRTVLHGVQWSNKIERTTDSQGKMYTVSEVSITVPEREGYVPAKEYAGEGFTFGIDNLDVVVYGICTDEITDEYTITDLKKNHDKVVTVYAVKDNTNRQNLKHWRVSAK